jgi:hypothetical protein
MGFNTTVVVYNDALDAIKKDPEFGRKLSEACMAVNNPNATSSELSPSAGNHANAAIVVETHQNSLFSAGIEILLSLIHNADQMRVIAVGGNLGQEVGYGGSWHQDMRKPEDRVELIRMLADQEGYNIRKRPQKFDPEPIAAEVIRADEQAASE